MKTTKIITLKFVLFLLICTTMSSCQQTEVVLTDYPDEIIYLPAALNGIYNIDNLPTKTLFDPTSGNPYKFTVNIDVNEFNIPLSVFRSGIKLKDAISVDIAINTDTITKLITQGTLISTEILPATMFKINSSVNVESGKNVGTFNLNLDLKSLKTNAPTKKYAIAINISSKARKSNPLYNTVIIIIDTKIMIPTANFSFVVDQTTSSKINFTNTSLYAVSYLWDFGDGTTSTDINTAHSYSQSGTYSVKLNATGLSGDVVTQIQSVNASL